MVSIIPVVIGWLEPDSRFQAIEAGENYEIEAGLFKPQTVEGTYRFEVDFTDITAC